MKKLLVALMVGAGVAASTWASSSAESAADGALILLGEGGGYNPGDNPGGDNPPGGLGGGGETGGGGEGQGGGGEGGGGEGGGEPGSSTEPTLTGALVVDSVTNIVNETFESVSSNENVILVRDGGELTASGCTLTKSGDTSSEDNSNFYALNAVMAVKSNSTAYVDHLTINSNANGANCLFASGTNSTIYAYDCEINSTCGSSRGLDATYKGTIIAAKMTINTEGEHCAALATDRGNGYISARDSKLFTKGNGSPLIYSTGAIEVNSVTGEATGAQIAGIEGLSVIRIKDSILSGSEKKASEPISTGVIIYQSMSGDYTTGTATFEVADSTLISAITNNGAMFYITNTKAIITVKNTELDFDSDENYLIKAAGNDCNDWGTSGENGGEVVFTAIDQTLKGNISVDGISSNDLYLINSTYTGKFIKDTTYSGNGGASVFMDATSKWTVTADCTLKNLTIATGAKIVDANSQTVKIVNSSGTTLVEGESDITVTVSTYSAGATVEAPYTINDFGIDRTAFEEMYATSQFTPGVASEPYDDAQSATNAAAAINADKASYISVPEDLAADQTEAYLAKVEATVTSDNCIVVDLTAAAALYEQALVNVAVTGETAVVALTSTNDAALVTIAPTTPGLYYWLKGGTEVNAITNAGEGVLSTDGGELKLSKPALDASKGAAFFKVAAGVAAP